MMQIAVFVMTISIGIFVLWLIKVVRNFEQERTKNAANEHKANILNTLRKNEQETERLLNEDERIINEKFGNVWPDSGVISLSEARDLQTGISHAPALPTKR